MNTDRSPSVHLICNAHLDPVWLWEWQEGMAEALSTFRTAADLCEEFDGFVFNHNEALLYECIEQFEPALFRRIQRLVEAERWHIMGGWFLQPDCNMPSGESLLRQIQLGRQYFADRFGVRPTTAINFDSFGHTRGLVQILKQCGYDSYLVCRPLQGAFCDLESHQFIWRGFDGSEVLVSRAGEWYNSPLGKAREKVERWMASVADQTVPAPGTVYNKGKKPPARVVPQAFHVLWGVGNHGGGPSRKDLRDLAELIRESEAGIRHSTPESYFEALRGSGESLPVRENDLNPWGVGCYSSQCRIKQLHRRLENELYGTEKLATAASISGLSWPGEAFERATRDLCLAEFHDILPGSSIQPVEEQGMRILQHGLEEVYRVRSAAFFHLARGQATAKDGEIPVLVANPHPFTVDAVVACEFNLPDQNWGDGWMVPDVYAGRCRVPSQVEEEQSNLNLDWRKRVVFRAKLKPSGMTRFDCRLRRVAHKRMPWPDSREGGCLVIHGADVEARIGTRSGLLEGLRVGGRDVLAPKAFQPVVMHDSADPWGMSTTSFTKRAGVFKRMSAEAAASFAGVSADRLPPVRVIEHGEVRTVVEALLAYERSAMVIRYEIPREGTAVGVDVRVQWNEKDRMLKMRVPWHGEQGEPCFWGQTAFGRQEHACNGDEVAAHKWVALAFAASDRAITVINNGTYAFHADRHALHLTLLRSPAYAAHPITPERPLLPRDRFTERHDQGERLFKFWLNAGPLRERLARVAREADALNEEPMAVSFFPSGDSSPGPTPGIRLTGSTMQLSSFRKGRDGKSYVARVFNPLDRTATCELVIDALSVRERITLGGMVFRTYRIQRGRMEEVRPDEV